MVSPPYTFPIQPICVDCELMVLGGFHLPVKDEPNVISIRRRRIFCDVCMDNVRLQTAKQFLEQHLNIGQIILPEFAFLQFSWEEGKYDLPVLAMDVLPLPNEVFRCDDCYMECFHEFQFFGIQDQRLVFHYRYCGSCSRELQEWIGWRNGINNR